MHASIDVQKVLKVFELSASYNDAELKKAYKRLVLKYHPDVTQKISSTPMFQHLTEMYTILKEDLARRIAEKPHHQLKSHYTSQTHVHESPIVSSKKFDQKLFNQLFDENRIKDIHDEGYEKWRNDPESFKQKSTSLMVYKEPSPLVSTLGNTEYYELGANKVKDFSSKQPSGMYMDYRLAHTTSELIDEKKIKHRKEYKNVEELEKDRSTISFQMNDRELRKYHDKKRLEDELEKKRLANLSKRDQSIFSNYSRVHNVITQRILK